MRSDFLKFDSRSLPYSRIDQENIGQDLLERNDFDCTNSSTQSRWHYYLLSAMLIALGCMAGYFLGLLNHHAGCESIYVTGIVSNGKTSTFQLNCSQLTTLSQYQ